MKMIEVFKIFKNRRYKNQTIKDTCDTETMKGGYILAGNEQ
jgi:hypothetical protein